MAAELGEAANGGQVLLSHDAWLRLQGRMHEASFPVVEQLGSYKLNAWPVPLPVYQASLLSCLHASHLTQVIIWAIIHFRGCCMHHLAGLHAQ